MEDKMGTAVLKEIKQVSEARALLASKGLEWRKHSIRRILEKMRLIPKQPDIGDELKSWDVLRTAEFAIEHLNRTDSVLDLGAFASEILIVLHKSGFSNLTGADLNPSLLSMPYSDKIRYRVTDFLKTPFDDGSFSMITAISVIEHGYQPDKLLTEVARLLRPGGFFVASFDYWPDKIATDGIKMFGMDWRIFSRQEIEQLIDKAATYGLTLLGNLDLDAKECPITCLDRHYTFAWISLKKIS
jgi:SAM-dependent methyltransferase